MLLILIAILSYFSTVNAFLKPFSQSCMNFRSTLKFDVVKPLSITKLSVVTLDGEENKVLYLNSYKVRLNSLVGLTDSDWREWTDRPSPSECFGPEKRKRRVGRETEIRNIWRKIEMSSTETPATDTHKSTCYYIHGSPGMGKSYILQQLLKKNANDTKDVPEELVANTMFVALDLNNDIVNRIEGRSRDLAKWDPSLIPLLRVFHNEFLKDYSWPVLIGNVISLSKSSPGAFGANSELMINTIRGLLTVKCALLGHKYIVPLVDELGKTRKLAAKWPGKFRSAICSWSDKGSSLYFVPLSLFSTLDRKLMLSERTESRRPVKAATTLPLFTLSESILYLEDQLRCSFYFDGFPADRKQAVEFLAQVSGGHPRSLEYIAGRCNFAYKRPIADVVAEAGASLSAAYPVELWDDVIKLALLGNVLPLTYKVPGTKETIESLINRGMLLGSLDNSDVGIWPVLPEMYLYWWSSPPTVSNGQDATGLSSRLNGDRASGPCCGTY